tara:strand:+ start:233422 stop:233697 length:276 start_codon:yes stop_codon:yes gene_type:complete
MKQLRRRADRAAKKTFNRCLAATTNQSKQKKSILARLRVLSLVLVWSWPRSAHLTMLHPVAVAAVRVFSSLTWAFMPRPAKESRLRQILVH